MYISIIKQNLLLKFSNLKPLVKNLFHLMIYIKENIFINLEITNHSYQISFDIDKLININIVSCFFTIRNIYFLCCPSSSSNKGV